jgi:hypothetical protein
MQVSLQLQIGDRYSIISLLFFVPYIIFVSTSRHLAYRITRLISRNSPPTLFSVKSAPATG